MTEVSVDDVLKGFSIGKMIPCIICKAIIDHIGQDLESKSDFYSCANCIFTINEPRK